MKLLPLTPATKLQVHIGHSFEFIVSGTDHTRPSLHDNHRSNSFTTADPYQFFKLDMVIHQRQTEYIETFITSGILLFFH